MPDVGSRDRCHMCKQSIKGDPFPEILLHHADHAGWEDEARRTEPMECTACQVAHDAGLRALAAAVDAMPQHACLDGLAHDLLPSLRIAARLDDTDAGCEYDCEYDEKESSPSQSLAHLIGRFATGLDLPHVFTTLADLAAGPSPLVVCGSLVAARAMRRVALHALGRADEVVRGLRVPDRGVAYDERPDLEEAADAVQTAEELEDFLVRVRDRVRIARDEAQAGEPDAVEIVV